jgi:fatty aldehyde-generating acyl-ACP reductase
MRPTGVIVNYYLRQDTSLTASDLRPELSPGAIICDAGYPRNLSFHFTPYGCPVFYGGLGQASGGIKLDPDLLGIMYPYGPGDLTHGCLLEGIVLAMERRFEPFSRGRGLITPERVGEMWRMAGKHGIGLPTLFNGEGSAEEEMLSLRGIGPVTARE